MDIGDIRDIKELKEIEMKLATLIINEIISALSLGFNLPLEIKMIERHLEELKAKSS